MPTATGLILVKSMDYRDEPNEEWSNKYWLTGLIPASDAEWKALADTIIALEKTCYYNSSKVVRAYGYNNSDEHSPTVWVYDYDGLGQSVPGTLPFVIDTNQFAGDQAGMCWWRTSRRNARGKWIYLRKFFHDGFTAQADKDTLSGDTLAAYGSFVLKLMDGTLPNGRIIRSPLQDETLTVGEASAWVTTRTLKRRGKRPPAAAPTP